MEYGRIFKDSESPAAFVELWKSRRFGGRYKARLEQWYDKVDSGMPTWGRGNHSYYILEMDRDPDNSVTGEGEKWERLLLPNGQGPEEAVSQAEELFLAFINKHEDID